MQSKDVKLSIIVINYASSQKIERLLISLKDNEPSFGYEVIIVDNFSSEAEKKRLKELKESFVPRKKTRKNPPQLHGDLNIIELHQNFGYGYANNEAATFAQGKYLAIINPDIELQSEIFGPLIEQLNKLPQAGICVPALQTHHGQVLDNAREFPTPRKIMTRRLLTHKPGKKFASPTAIDWAQGSFWIIKKSIYEEIKGFDDRFFLFFEDTDLCRRVQTILKRKIYIVPDCVAIHDPNRLSGGNILVALFRRTFWIHIMSAFKYFWKWR